MTTLAPIRPRRADLTGTRTLIVHEWLYTWGGAERCLQAVADLFPAADIVIGTITDEARARYPVARRARETWLGKVPGSRRYHRWFLPLQAAAFSTIDTTDYDLVVTLSHSMGKLVRPAKQTIHLCYCFSPPRYLWDLHDTYDAHQPMAQGVALRTGRRFLRALDRHGASGVHDFVAISRCVAGRIRRAYGRESAVVYPPVTVKDFTARRRDSFLLSLGRLVPYKRVDLAIRAAEELGMPLIVAGDGPDRQRLERLAGKHTTFVGFVSEEHAARLMASCAAFLFCGEEDFGIAPLEANAHGAPVVAYGSGGALETMVDGVSGVFFAEPSVAAVVDAIERCRQQSWDDAALKENAARFSPERFRESLSAEIARALARP